MSLVVRRGTFATSVFGDRHAGNPPIVRLNFLNNDEDRGWVLLQHTDEQIRRPLDQFFLLFGRGSLTSDPNVNIWHEHSPWVCRLLGQRQ